MDGSGCLHYCLHRYGERFSKTNSFHPIDYKPGFGVNVSYTLALIHKFLDLSVSEGTVDVSEGGSANPTARNSLPEELVTAEKFPEGARHSVIINAYERNPKARAACIAHHGDLCAVCGFNFAKAYGALGDGFIHVHHIVPIGEIGKQYEIDPKKDLIPVCPNCHAMIHHVEPP